MGALFAAGCTPPEAPTFHPIGYAAPSVHAAPFKLQQVDCRPCHGADLAGGAPAGEWPTDVGCDSCHDDGWRQDCTLCHGGDETEGGAPPRDIDGRGGPDGTFAPHTTHVTGTVHAEWDCTQCHVQPEDVLSDGHVLDDTPGRAEVLFDAGQSPQTVWDSVGCSNNACHGDGLSEGQVLLSDAPLTCDGCHPGPESLATDQSDMSGDHLQHTMHGIPCSWCHPNVDPQGEIIDPTTHVDLAPTVGMPESITVDSGHCSGLCHEYQHFSISW